MSYEILRRNPEKGTIVVRYADGRRVHLRLPEHAQGSPEFDAEVLKWEKVAAAPSWYNAPGDENPYKRTMPIHDRRSR